MGTFIDLQASDGHGLAAYRADPAGRARGGIVVLQEIFGVNSHIRSICDRVAAAGYAAVAPALFDRCERGFESGYSEAEVAHARTFLAKIDWEAMMRDAVAAADALRPAGPVAMVGFCMGGSLAYLAATRRNDLSASVCFYGSRIAALADARPRCPTQMHFGEKDHGIPLSDVETVRTKRPDCEIHVYPGAGHGFNCDERASYDPESAALAWQRTLAWLKAHVG